MCEIKSSSVFVDQWQAHLLAATGEGAGLFFSIRGATLVFPRRLCQSVSLLLTRQ